MQETLFQQGFDLMLFGMGMVFVFLALLVVCTISMSKVVQTFFPETDETPVNNPVAPPSTAGISEVDPRTLAIIKDAIRQHRS